MTDLRTTLSLAATVATLACAGSAVAQQQPAPRKPAVSSQQYYEAYQASHRQRLRRETCMRDEDPVGKDCIKRCAKGYINTTGNAVPRNCRGQKPLPPGQLPQPYTRQQAVQPVPPPPSKSVPGA
jgi:hypothetical protein